MNYLAHFLLSFDRPALIVGNFVADAVKGKAALAQYPDDIRQGILLHRAIDTFTDEHPAVLQSKRLLYAEFGKWAPVLVDLYYDYVLALHWEQYGPVGSIQNFAHRTYRVLAAHSSQVPEPIRTYLPDMIAHNWLMSYTTPQGMQHAVERMVRRRPAFPSPLAVVAAMLRQLPQFEQHFHEFFPVLRQHAAAYVNTP